MKPQLGQIYVLTSSGDEYMYCGPWNSGSARLCSMADRSQTFIQELREEVLSKESLVSGDRFYGDTFSFDEKDIIHRIKRHNNVVELEAEEL